MVCNSRYGPGYKRLCKKCDGLRGKRYRELHKKEVSKQRKEHYRQNKERILLHKKDQYERTKEKRQIYSSDYHAKNKDLIRKQKKVYQKNRLIIDPIYKFKRTLSTRIRHAFKGIGNKKSQETWSILGTDKKGLIEHFLITQNIDITKEYRTAKFVIDHICPLDQAVNEIEIIKLNHFSNLQLLSSEQNRDKWNHKTPEGEILCKKLLGRDWHEN